MVNLVVVAVVYVALVFGPVTGHDGGHRRRAGAGRAGGRDGRASAACRRRSSASWPALLGAQFIVAQPLPRFVMFVSRERRCTRSVYQGLSALVEVRPFRLPYAPVLTQAAINGMVGLAAFFMVERVPGHAPAPPGAPGPILGC